MRFADPQACPDCRGAIAGQPACPSCGLDLTSLEVRQLWQVLLQADELLARAARRPRAAAALAQPARPQPAPSRPAPPPGTPPAPPGGAFVPGPATPVFPTPGGPPPPSSAPATPGAAPAGAPDHAWRMRDPGPAPAAATERSWSVGTILLVLGAFGLIVAGLIFVTRSWEDIGLVGRTLILLAVTAVIGALGVWVTRRPLRASAEAVWAVFLALLTLDFFAARHEDLAGLGSIDVAGGWVVWGVAALGLSGGIAVWARPHVKADLVVPAVAGGLAITLAGIGAAALGDDWDFAWRALVALVVAGVLALATRPVGSPPLTVISRVVIAAFYVFAYVAAAVEAGVHPALDDLVADGHGGPLLLMVVASVVIAWLVPVVRIPAVALAVVGAAALVVVPVVDAGSLEVTWTVLTALAVALAAASSRGASAWMIGVRVGATPAVAAVLVIQLVLVAETLATLGTIAEDPWSAAWDTRLDVAAVDDHALWVVPIVLAGLLATTWFVMAWPELTAVRSWRTAALGAVLSVGAVTSVVAVRWPIWAGVAALLMVAAVVAILRLRGVWSVPTAATLILVLAASALAAGSHGVSAAAWAVGGAVLVGVAFASRNVALGRAHAAVGTGLLVAGAAAATALPDVDDSAVPLAAVIVALALMAAARLGVPAHPVAPAIELTAGVALAGALIAPAGSGQIAVRWTIGGVALIALGLVAGGRRWLVWPGLAALVVAYVALIVDSGFSFVEAYTLPLGVAALAVGLWATTRRPDAGTWALLGPGLALALLPSVPQALADPTGLRALLLGAGALAVLAVAVRLGWQAPFVAGTTILTLILLFNIGPYANAAPRVVLIAIVSAVLLGIGITWEDRVRDGRKLVAYVRSMR